MAAKKPTTNKSRSVQAKVDAAQFDEFEISPPPGCPELTATEMVVFRQYVSSRLEWKDWQLRDLVKLCQMETHVQMALEESFDAPLTIMNDQGTELVNPVHKSTDLILNRWYAINRKLKFMVSEREGERLNGGSGASNRHSDPGDDPVAKLGLVPKRK